MPCFRPRFWIYLGLGALFEARKNLDLARQMYEQAVALAPASCTALRRLSLLLYRRGDYDRATRMREEAFRLCPGRWAIANDYANLLIARREFNRAHALLTDLLARRRRPAVLRNLGIYHQETGDLAAAERLYRESLRDDPAFADAYNCLGLLQLKRNELTDAMASFEQALALDRDLAVAYLNLGSALQTKGEFDEAFRVLTEGLLRYPEHPMLLNLAGIVLIQQGKAQQALDFLRKALARDRSANNLQSLGLAYKDDHQLHHARDYFEAALAIEPDNRVAQNNLGGVYLSLRDPDRAAVLYRSAGEHDSDMFSNYLMSLTYSRTRSLEEVFEEHRQWERLHGLPRLPQAGIYHHPRIHLGYVSPDFRSHPVGHLFLGALRNHDRARFEVFCYSDTRREDAMTNQIAAASEHWLKVVGWSHARLAERVRSDQIDILVDLTGHTGMNRLPAFSMKPAPVQVSWIGYFHSTGLSAMDYFITDEYSTPEQSMQLFSEQPIRLPRTRFTYTPPEDIPAVAEAPQVQNRYITLGSFNFTPKLNDEVLELWVDILRDCPNTRLYLKSFSFADRLFRREMRAFFAQRGIDSARIKINRDSPHYKMLEEYRCVDLALDPYPFTGCLTTLEAALMGVPTVTRAGEPLVSRQGLAILANVGLGDFVVESDAEYKAKVIALVQRPSVLRELRSTLRDRLLRSPMCDHARFTAELEQAYVVMMENLRNASPPGAKQ